MERSQPPAINLDRPKPGTKRRLSRRLISALLTIALLASGLAGSITAASATSHQGFDQFDADATGRNYTNAYLLSLMSHYVYDGNLPGATGVDFKPTFEAYFTNLGLSSFTYIDIFATDTQAMVAETDDAVIVAFRGTQQPGDFVIDALITPTRLDGIHEGFSLAALSALPDVVAAIGDAPGKEVWLTGHSLGGAVAQATAYYFAAANALTAGSAPDVQGIVTIGSPRVFTPLGDAGALYSAIYSDAESQRWVNNIDPVPHLIPAPLYIHKSPWTLITVDDAEKCAVASQATHTVLLPDLADHDTARYTARMFSLMTDAERVGLPLPPTPDPKGAQCDDLPNLPPSAPADIDSDTNEVAEGSGVGTQVGLEAASTDPNGGGPQFSLTDDAGGRFTIGPATGLVMVADPSLLDYEDATSHQITVQASDGALSASSNFTITVTNVAPSAPTDSNGATNEVAEGTANGTAVGVTAASTDPNGPAVSYSLTDDAGGRFAIGAASGVVTVADGSLLNYEDATSHQITAKATDGTLSASSNFTITVTDVAPTAPADRNGLMNKVAEGAAVGTTVGVTAASTDPNGPAVSYSLTDNAGGRFAIGAASGVVTVADGSLLDGPDTHNITVQAGAGALTSSTVFSIGVYNVAPNPSVDTLDGGLDGVALVGVPVSFGGSFTDPAPADTHTATLDWDDGSARGATFGGGKVTSSVGAAHTYSAAGDYTVHFDVTDDDGGVGHAIAGITVYDGAGAATAVLDDIDARLGTETDPDVLAALQLARDDLDGNDGGASDNGAIDELEAGDLVAALIKLAKVIEHLEDTEVAGGADASDLKQLLALAAQSVAQGVFDDATAAVGPSPSNGEQKQLTKIAAAIADGTAELAISEYSDAVDDFRTAVRIAAGLLP